MATQTSDADDGYAITEHKKEESEIKPLPVWKLFKGASYGDVFLMIIATLLSIVAGTAFPFVIMIVGLAINEFTTFIVTQQLLTALALNDTSTTHFCDNSTFTGFEEYLFSPAPNDLLKNELYKLTYYMLAVATGHIICLFLSNVTWSVVAFHIERRLKNKFLSKVLHLDAEYYDLHNATELSPLLIEDVGKITASVSTAFGEIWYQTSAVFVSLGIALSFDWTLALVVNSVVVLLFILLGIFAQLDKFAGKQEQTHLTLASSLAEQVMLSMKTVMAYGGQSIEQKRYEAHLQRAQRYSYMKTLPATVIFSSYALLLFGIFSLGFWYGGQRFISCSGILPGDIVIVIYVTAQLCLSTGYLVLPLEALNRALVSGAAVFNVIETEVKIDIEEYANMTTLDSFKGNIKLSDLVFSYPSRSDVRVLHGIDLHIKPGQTVALVGPSGCGKSTIMKLIPRIYDTDGGTVLLDECNIRELSVKWLRNQIGIVSQEPALFNISIAENISYGKEGATQEDIEAAAEAANAHDFIMSLPDGYDTIVGGGGSQISGGQKQRIAIARALVRDPKILLLDEATSALDTKSEKLVQQALDKASEGRTTIIIAHRLSTIRTADVIVGIDKGRVVEMGSHSELMEKQGLYYKLVMSQSTEETDEEKNEEKGFRYELRKTQKTRHRRQSMSPHQSPTRKRRYTRSQSVHVTMLPKSIRSKSFNKIDPSINKVEIPLQTIEGDLEGSDLPNARPNDEGVAESEKSSYLDLFRLLNIRLLFVGVFFFCLIGIHQCSLYILMAQTLQVFTETDPTVLERDLNLYVYLYAGLGVIGAILYVFGTAALVTGSDRSTRIIRQRLFKAILSQDAQYFDKEANSISVLLSNLTDNPGYIREVSGVAIGFAIRVVFAALGSIIVSLYASWVIALVTLPSYAVLVGAWVLENYVAEFYVRKADKFIDQSNSLAVEVIENIATIESLSITDRIMRTFDSLLSPSYKYLSYKAIVHGFLYGLAESSVIFASAAALSVSGVIFVDDTTPYHASLSNIFLALAAVLFTGVVFKDAFNSLNSLQKATISASEIYRRIVHGNPKAIDSFGDTIEPFSGDISACSLFFSYASRPGIKILNGLDVKVKSGQTLALVGPSGSGKSTIISLLERFYDPTFGDLQLDGKDVRNLNLSWLRQQISLVSQEPVLFDMSIADNIRYGANFREVIDEEIQEAAKSANIHDFILSQPEGYNTIVGLKGTQLSGGQKQRIAIARALVRNPKILLLDEATSALDTESERIVQEALDKAREGRTTVIIAHRLSTIQNADCIAVLHRGRVIEHGTHSELMNKKGAYSFMVQGF